MCVCVAAHRELASQLLDVVKVATVVKELPCKSFIYSPVTKFDYITSAFNSVLLHFNHSNISDAFIYIYKFRFLRFIFSKCE